MIQAFTLFGILIGIFITLVYQRIYAIVHDAREKQIVARAREEALRVRVKEAPTEHLLEEISTRDDLVSSRTRNRRNG